MRPHIVVAGVNAGSNLGDDVTYSGTVSAAMEGTLLGVPGLAVSLVKPSGAGELPSRGAGGGPAGAAAPAGRGPRRDAGERERAAGEPRGVRVTRLGRRLYSEKVVERQDPRGRRYFWIGAGPPAWEAGEDTDYAAVHAGYVSVTPLMLDLTDYPALRTLKDWEGEYRRPARGRGKRSGAMTGGRAVGTGAGWQEARAARERERMVEEQLVQRGITDTRVLDAMRRVPRHRFVEEALRDRAYGDHPLPIGESQTISQPYIVGMMTQLLALTGSEKVLEIGTRLRVPDGRARRAGAARLLGRAADAPGRPRPAHPGGVGVY